MKAIISAILICFSLLIFIGCEKKGENICSSTSFIFVNQAGEDIFNPSTPSHIDISDFDIITPDDKIKMNFYNYFVNDTNLIEIGINGLSGEGYTYLKFGNLNIDTIYAKYKESGNSLFINELYYNGNLIEINEFPTQCGTKGHKITVTND